MGYKLGRSCVTQILLGEDWVNWGTIREQTITWSAETVDADCRDGDNRSVNAKNFGADAPIGYSVEVTQTVKMRADDAVLKYITEKMDKMEPIEAKIGDGGFGLDVSGVFQITSSNNPQTLKDIVTFDITLNLVEFKTYT